MAINLFFLLDHFLIILVAVLIRIYIFVSLFDLSSRSETLIQFFRSVSKKLFEISFVQFTVLWFHFKPQANSQPELSLFALLFKAVYQLFIWISLTGTPSISCLCTKTTVFDSFSDQRLYYWCFKYITSIIVIYSRIFPGSWINGVHKKIQLEDWTCVYRSSCTRYQTQFAGLEGSGSISEH